MKTVSRLLAGLALALVALACQAQVSPKWAALYGGRHTTTAAVTFSSSLGFYLDADSQIGTADATGLGGVTSTTSTLLHFSILGSHGTASNTTLFNATPVNQNPAGLCEPAGGANAYGDCWVASDNSGTGNTTRVNLNNAAGNVGVQFAADGAFVDGQWLDVVASVDSAHQVAAWAINGAATAYTGPGVTLNQVIDIANAIGWGMGNRQNGGVFYGWLDNVYQSTDAAVCFSTASITVNGVTHSCAAYAGTPIIPADIVAAFYTSGKAVELGSTCALPTGRQPELCFNTEGAGPATNKGFATGVGLRSTSASAQTDFKVASAPYGLGQGIPAHQATMKWVPSVNYNFSSTCTASCAFTINTNGQPVAAGELLVAGMWIADNGAFNNVFTCPSGWTAVGPTFDSGNEVVASNLCYIVAPNTTNSWSASYVTGGSPATKGWFVVDYGNVASVDTGATSCAVQTQNTTWTTPSHTTASANETLVSIAFGYQSSFQHPTAWADTLRYTTPVASSGALAHIMDAYAVASGSNTARTITASRADNGVVCSLGLVPN